MRVKPKNKAVKGSGDLKERITFFGFTQVTDLGGGIEGDRVDIKTIWADVVPMTGKRALEGLQIIGNNPHAIHTRAKSLEVNNDMMIDWKGKILAIHSAIKLVDVFEIIAFEKT